MTTVETLPPEILGGIFEHLTHKQLRANSSAILRTNRLFHRIGADEIQKSVELNLLDLLHLQEPKVDRVRHISIGLNGFEQCCQYHTLCGRRLFHCPHTGTFNTARGFADFVNDRLGDLLPLILRKTSNLQSFSLKAYCAQLAVSPMQCRESFIRPSSIIGILHGLAVPGVTSKLTELVLDTDCSEEGSWTPSRGIGDKCEEHVCPVIARTIASLPMLRKLRLRRRDICPQALSFFDNDDSDNSQWPESTERMPRKPRSLESVVVNLRLSELQCTGQSVWAAQSRHCQCHCPCETCFRASELLHGSWLPAGGEARTATPPPPEGANTAAAPASLSAADKFEQWKHWRYLEQKQNQSMFEEMLTALGRVVAASSQTVKHAQVLGYRRPYRELANVYREPIVGSIGRDGKADVTCDETNVFSSVW